MENNINEEIYTKEEKKKNKENLEFSIAFSKNGDSFQNIMEKILISKLAKSTNNE